MKRLSIFPGRMFYRLPRFFNRYICKSAFFIFYDSDDAIDVVLEVPLRHARAAAQTYDRKFSVVIENRFIFWYLYYFSF